MGCASGMQGGARSQTLSFVQQSLEQQMPLKSGQPDWALYYALWDERSDTEDR